MSDAVPPSALGTALRARCPRCGRGRLYAGLLAVVPQCGACGLDLRGEDAGDGAAAFVILILGFLVVGLAGWVELALTPPFWVHVLLWPVPVVVGAVWMTRTIKAWLIAQQYRHRALGSG